MNTDPQKGYIVVNLKSVEELQNVVNDFTLYGQLKIEKRKTITDWVRERFIIEAGVKQTIEFGEMATVDMLCMETSGAVMLDIKDNYGTGFGDGGFGYGGFGGTENPLKGFHVNGILMLEGKYAGMIMTNNTDDDITVDLYAAVYEQ